MKKMFVTCVVALCLLGCDASEGLRGYEYQLSEESVSLPITLTFSDKVNNYYGKAVNNYFGKYTLDGQSLELSHGGISMMMGAPDEMAAERAYLDALPEVVRYEQLDDTLVLITKDGKQLKFKKAGPAEY